jgi:hypothetical protein
VPVIDHTRSPIGHRRRRDAPVVVVAAVFAVALFALVFAQLREPPRVARLTLVNPTDYGVRVMAHTDDDPGSFALGWVWDHSETVVRDGPDLGDTWVFRLSYDGVVAGEWSVTRAQLAADGWRFTIPSAVAERLAAEGRTPAYHDPRFGG